MAAFRSDDKDLSGKFDPIPANKYNACMVKADRTKAKKKGNAFLACEFKVVKGDFKGRSLWANLNLINDNDTAQEIGQTDLKRIMAAVGVKKIDDMWDATPLLNKELVLKVTVKDSEQYGPQNEVRGYMEADGGDKKSGKKDKKAPKLSKKEQKAKDKADKKAAKKASKGKGKKNKGDDVPW